MSVVKPIVPTGEALRKAVRWLAEQGCADIQTVEQAARRFDLSPREEEFLVREFVQHKGISG